MSLQSGKAGAVCLAFFLLQVLSDHVQSGQPQNEQFCYGRIIVTDGQGFNRVALSPVHTGSASIFSNCDQFRSVNWIVTVRRAYSTGAEGNSIFSLPAVASPSQAAPSIFDGFRGSRTSRE